MSDPATNVEIEDVLSSIRRLVSDEGRAARDAGDVQPKGIGAEHEEGFEAPDQPSEEGAPALILTPALRVTDEADVALYDQDPVAADEAAHMPEDALAEMPEPLVLEWQDATHDDASVEISETLDVERDIRAEGAKAVEIAEDLQCEIASDSDENSYENTAGDDAGEADEIDAPDTGLMGDGAAFEDIEETEGAAPDEAVENTDLPPQACMDEAGQGRSIEDKIAALEALIGKSDSEFEPDGAEANSVPKAKSAGLPWTEEAAEPALPDPETASQDADFNAEAIAFQAAHAAATKEAEDGVIEAMAHTLPDGLGDDATALIDEEALRDMVADIVRQELQGPLGERITRNVRKLVRREIYRAMAANELD